MRLYENLTALELVEMYDELFKCLTEMPTETPVSIKYAVVSAFSMICAERGHREYKN